MYHPTDTKKSALSQNRLMSQRKHEVFTIRVQYPIFQWPFRVPTLIFSPLRSPFRRLKGEQLDIESGIGISWSTALSMGIIPLN